MMRLALSKRFSQFVQFLLLVNHSFIKQLRLLGNLMQLLLSYTSSQLVMHLITFHSRDHMLQSFGLHASLLKPCLHLLSLLCMCSYQTMHFFTLLNTNLIFVSKKIDVSTFETHARQLPATLL